MKIRFPLKITLLGLLLLSIPRVPLEAFDGAAAESELRQIERGGADDARQAALRTLVGNNGGINARDEQERTLLHIAAQGGLTKVVGGLLAVDEIDVLAVDEIDVNARDAQGHTPLWWSFQNRYPAIPGLLLAEGAQGDFKATAVEARLGEIAAMPEADGRQTALRTLVQGQRDYGGINSRDEQGRTLLHVAAQLGFVELVRNLLDQDSIDPLAPAKWGRTPLNLAVRNGHVDAARELLVYYNAQRADPRYAADIRRARTLVIKGEVVFKVFEELNLVDCTGNPAERPGVAAVKALLLAKFPSRGTCTIDQARERIESLLQIGKYEDSNKVCVFGQTLLHLAVVERNEVTMAVMGLLAMPDIEVDARSKSGETPLALIVASSCGFSHSEKVTKALLDAGADVYIKDKNGMSPLYWAVKKHKRDWAVDMLLEKGADKEDWKIRDAEENSLLHEMAKEGLVEWMEKLLESGLDINVKNVLGETVVYPAILELTDDGRVVDVINWLAEKGLEFNAVSVKGSRNALQYAAENGRSVTILTLLEKSKEMFRRALEDKEMATKAIMSQLRAPVSQAVAPVVGLSGHPEIAQALLALVGVETEIVEERVEVTRREENGRDVTRTLSGVEIFPRKLIITGRGVDGGDVGTMVRKALHSMGEVDFDAVKKALDGLWAGDRLKEALGAAMAAMVNAADDRGDTVLHLAAKNCCLEAVQALLGVPDIDIDARNNQGQTALFIAAGGNGGGGGEDGGALADRAMKQIDITKALLTAGAKVDIRDIEGKTALHAACVECCLENVRELLAPERAFRRARKLPEDQPLSSEQAAALTQLPKLDVNVVDSKGRTALHFALNFVYTALDASEVLEVSADVFAVMRTLLDAGAKVDIRDDKTLKGDGGEKVDIRDNKTPEGDGDETALHLAARSASPKVVLLLLAYLPPVADETQAAARATLLTECEGVARTGAQEAFGEDVKARFATTIKILEAFRHHGTVWHAVAAAGDLDSMKWYLDLRKEQLTAQVRADLGDAAEATNVEGKMKQLLIREINTVGADGYTPLHLAAESGHWELVKLLLDNRALIDAKTTAGRTVLDLAEEKGGLDALKEWMEGVVISRDMVRSGLFLALWFGNSVVTGGILNLTNLEVDVISPYWRFKSDPKCMERANGDVNVQKAMTLVANFLKRNGYNTDLSIDADDTKLETALWGAVNGGNLADTMALLVFGYRDGRSLEGAVRVYRARRNASRAPNGCDEWLKEFLLSRGIDPDTGQPPPGGTGPAATSERAAPQQPTAGGEAAREAAGAGDSGPGAMTWRLEDGIYLPAHQDAPKAYCVLGSEAKPLALAGFTLEGGARLTRDSAEVGIWMQLPTELRAFLRRLGVTVPEGRDASTIHRKVVFTMALHRPDALDGGIFVDWRYAGEVGTGVAAVRLFKLRCEMPRWEIDADEAERAGGPRVKSLPNGFLKRKFPGTRDDRKLWRLRVDGRSVSESWGFASLVVGSEVVFVSIDAIPQRTSLVTNSAELSQVWVNCFGKLPAATGTERGVSSRSVGGSGESTKSLKQIIEDDDAAALSRSLSRSSMNVNASQEGMSFGALYEAVLGGKVASVQVLAKTPGINPNVQGADGRTPLHVAAFLPDAGVALGCVRALLTIPNIDVNAKDGSRSQRTPLYMAVQNKKPEIVAALLASGKVDIADAERIRRVFPRNSEAVRQFLLKETVKGPEPASPPTGRELGTGASGEDPALRRWKEVDGIYLPRNQELPADYPRIGGEEAPLALASFELSAGRFPVAPLAAGASKEARVCELLPVELQDCLQRLGVVSRTGEGFVVHSPLSVTYVLHRSDVMSRSVQTAEEVLLWGWKSGGSAHSVSAVRFFESFGGEVRFKAGWDETERSGAPRVASLPGGFFKRMLSRSGDRSTWQELRVSDWSVEDELAFYTLIVEPGRTRMIWEILPVQDSKDWGLAEIDGLVLGWVKTAFAGEEQPGSPGSSPPPVSPTDRASGSSAAGPQTRLAPDGGPTSPPSAGPSPSAGPQSRTAGPTSPPSDVPSSASASSAAASSATEAGVEDSLLAAARKVLGVLETFDAGLLIDNTNNELYSTEDAFGDTLYEVCEFVSDEVSIGKHGQLSPFDVAGKARALADVMVDPRELSEELKGLVEVNPNVMQALGECIQALRAALKEPGPFPLPARKSVSEWRAAEAGSPDSPPPVAARTATSSPAAASPVVPPAAVDEEPGDADLAQLFRAVRADDSFSLRDLLARDDSDLVNETDAQGRTALHIAVSDPLRDHSSVIQVLLEKGTDVSLETADRKTALRLAIENGNGPAVRLFLSSVPMSVKDIKPLIDEFKDDPNLQIRAAVGNLERWGQNVALIAHAVETKNTDELKRLLRTTRVRLDSTTAMDQPLLGQMSSSGWLEGLQALLELRMTWMRTAVDPEYVKFLYQSSTRATTNPGFHACAPLLRRLYIVVTNWDPDTNKDALLQAVEAGNLEDVQLILADGVVCNSKNWGLLLVVESALKKGETDIARTVLSAMVAGSSAWIVLEDCMVGFFCTSDDRDEGRDQGKIDRFLRRFAQSYGFDIKIEVLESYEGIARQVVCLLVKDELMGAVVCGDVKELDRLLKPDVNVNARNGGGKSILHIAVECVFLGRHRELLGRSLSSARDVVMFSTAVLDRLLLVPNIDVNARDCNGSTPLHVALQLWDVRDDKEYPRCLDVVCRLLRKPSIDVNVRDEEGKTPLHCAAKWGYVEAVKKVLEAPDIDVSIRDNSGENALHVIEGEAECVSLLLATPGIDVNAQNDRERTPLVRKLSSRYELDQRVALELLKAPGLDIYAKDIKGKTALEYAVEKGCPEVLKVLLGRCGPESIERAQGLYERAQGLYNWRKKEIEREGTPTEEDMRAVYDRLSEEGNVHIEYNEWREQYRKDYAERQRLRYEECEKLRAEAARLLGDFLTKHGAAPAG